MSNLNHHNSNYSSKKTILGLSRNTKKIPSRSESQPPLRLESEQPSRSKSDQPTRLESEQPSRSKSNPPSRLESEMRILTESGKNNIESSNQLLFDNTNINNILYPANNNKLNNITDIDYNSNYTELSNISIQLVNECINWASQYHLASPYLYELSSKTAFVHNNITDPDFNFIYFKLYKGSIDEFYVPRANKFNITVLIIIMYTIYLLKNDINNDTVYSSILDYVNNKKYQSEINQLININSYKLSDEYKLYFYNSFIKKSLYAYKTANEFYNLGGHAYITSLHGEPITNTHKLFFEVPKNVKIGFLAPLETYSIITTNNRNIYYLSRDIGLKNILTLGPNYYQNINNNIPSELINMNIYHEGQLVPNLSLSFSFKVVVSDIKLDLNQNKYLNYIKYSKKIKLYDNKYIYLTDIVRYIYNKLIKYFIKRESESVSVSEKKKKPKSKVHTKNVFTNNGVIYKYIYIQYDRMHFFHNMIIQNISTFHPDIINKLTSIKVTNKIKDIFKDYLNMADKTINILSNFDLNISLLSNEDDIYEYELTLSLPMNKYINIIDNELKNYKKANAVNKDTPGGNLYVFNSCRFYETIKTEYNNNVYKNSLNITKQLAITYITDITNKYVSSLVNKKPDKVKYKPYNNSGFDHTLNKAITNNTNNIVYLYDNKEYSLFTLNLSKDFLILFAISNIITNSKSINLDYTENSNILRNIKIALYNLFIKPRFDFKELTPYTISKLKMYTQKTNPVIKPNNIFNIDRKTRKTSKYTNSKKKILIVNEINSILYSKIKPSLGYLEVLFNNIVYFLIQYYLQYIKWIYNNYVLYINNLNYDSVENKLLKFYPLLYVPIHNYFNQYNRKDKTKRTTKREPKSKTKRNGNS